jgi:hypothetical protein
MDTAPGWLVQGNAAKHANGTAKRVPEPQAVLFRTTLPRTARRRTAPGDVLEAAMRRRDYWAS